MALHKPKKPTLNSRSTDSNPSRQVLPDLDTAFKQGPPKTVPNDEISLEDYIKVIKVWLNEKE
jgi:hypothetical protein